MPNGCSSRTPRVLILVVALAAIASVTAAEHLLWFDAAAQHFTESCPLGNGRLGAMLFGGVDEELLVLNEGGMWSGSAQEADRPNAAAALPEIRRLLLAGKNADAERLVDANFTCAGQGSGHGRSAALPYGSYQVLGNLRLTMQYGASPGAASDYRRELDLSQALARVSYKRGPVRFEREAFASAADQVIVLRLSADKPGALSFDLALDRPERFETTAVAPDGLLMTGQLADGHGGAGVRYAARLRVVPKGGRVEVAGSTLKVREAEEAVVLVAAETDIRSFNTRRVEDVLTATAGELSAAASRTHAELRRDHIAEYQRFFNRVQLRLGPEMAPSPTLATPARLRAFAEGAADPGLVQLYFDFGRYLLISSSRPGGLPANLQGIWAEGVQTPWNADWHLNINAQMNYWPAEVCNLSPLHAPLFDLVASLREPGTRTARQYYGARGWVAHVFTNPWGFTAPGESASWGSTMTGSAWLCQHLWDHFLFTRDRRFLAWAYPTMRDSARFYADVLIEEPKNGWLVTGPTNSPENRFLLADGNPAHVCLGPTYDMQLLRYLFFAVSDAADLLGVDGDFARELGEKAARLAPTRIGADGRVMEWLEEYREADPQHRHVSHLWGLYPGFEINATTPDLLAAARKTLDVRGDGGTGWCIAHKLALWARLGDGDRAHKLIRAQLKPATVVDRITTDAGGTYPNLFDSHPPFQIDGNFGATAGIAEMLLQSRPGEVLLLPALPAAWPEGEVRGLLARGGYEVDLSWQGGRLVTARIKSTAGERATVRLGSRSMELALRAGESIQLDGTLSRR
jgi:alpha-L-fucosidase 2